MSSCCSNAPFCACKKETILIFSARHLDLWQKALDAIGTSKNSLQNPKQLQQIGIIGVAPSIGAEIAHQLAMGDRGVVINQVTPKDANDQSIQRPPIITVSVKHDPYPDKKPKRKHANNYTPPKKKRK